MDIFGYTTRVRQKKKNPKIKLSDTSRDQSLKKSSQSSERNHDSVINRDSIPEKTEEQGKKGVRTCGKLDRQVASPCVACQASRGAVQQPRPRETGLLTLGACSG